MKIYLLEITASAKIINEKMEKLDLSNRFWEYSSNYAHVVVAENEEDARQIAIENCESWFEYEDLTSCGEIDLTVRGIVLTQYAQG